MVVGRVWKNIYKHLLLFKSNLSVKEGDGVPVLFWEDRWVGDQPLATKFPHLYALTSTKNWTIKRCAATLNGGGAWNSGLDRRLTDFQIEEVCSLTSLIQNSYSGIGVDSIKWDLDKSGKFTVKSCYADLEKENDRASLNLRIWSRRWSHKIGFFLWLVFHKRLATMDYLYKRGKLLGKHIYCVVLRGNRSHILCSIVNSLLKFGITLYWESVFCIDAIIKGWRCKLIHPIGKKLRPLIPAVICWTLWNSRNAIVFKNGSARVKKVMKQVKIQVYNWARNDEVFKGCALIRLLLTGVAISFL